MACHGDTECRTEDIPLNLTQEWLWTWELITAQDTTWVTFTRELHYWASPDHWLMVWYTLSLPSLPFPCFFCLAISACWSPYNNTVTWRKEEVLGLSHWPEKPTWVWGTCQLITKWSFYFPFVAVPCMCKTAARRWSGWAEQDSSAPWVLPPNSSKCSRPSNSKSGPRGDESQGVWEENDKEPWKSTAGKEEPLEVSE